MSDGSFNPSNTLPSTLSPLCTVSDLATQLKVPRQTIYYWVERNEIPFLRIGRHLRFISADVFRFFAEKTAQSKPNCNRGRRPVDNDGNRSLTIRATARTRDFTSELEE
ncbi:MAG: helix-turn-helix domain-containing protein [Deltaproteobacteria bacterium]|nr:helix-turn-helix domain-containing protein [Deltaproteobacteria bacterium]